MNYSRYLSEDFPPCPKQAFGRLDAVVLGNRIAVGTLRRSGRLRCIRGMAPHMALSLIPEFRGPMAFGHPFEQRPHDALRLRLR